MDMGADEIQAFLSYLANEGQAFVSTSHQALCARFTKRCEALHCPGLQSFEK
jgi:hypothetical protein